MSESLTDQEIALAAGYVLGDLDGVEQQSAAHLLETNPAFRAEVQALNISLQLVPHGLSQSQPPADLKRRTLAAFQDPLAGRRMPATKLLQFPNLLAAAGIIAALILGVDNWRLRSQLQLAQATDAANVATLMQNPRSRLVALQGEGDVAAAGTLLFTAGNWQEVIVSLKDLPPLAPDEVYRLWLSLETGEAIYCGEFRVGSEDAVFIRLLPPELPPAGVKATGIFVTAAPTTSPLTPTGAPLIRGEI